MNRVLVLSHPDCLAHDPGPNHPERAARLQAIEAVLQTPGFAGLMRRAPQPATAAQLQLAHPRAYVADILAHDGLSAALDPDTHVSPGSVRAALLAAGAAVAAVDAVLGGQADAAFAAIRPPGHHAEPDRAMGFCLFANAVIAARHARAAFGIRRVAVADFDVHHGNGTQAAFADDADLMLISSHQMPCYPGTGDASVTGIAKNIVNLPLAPGSGSAAFRAAWRRLGLPALRRFAPELLIISAGFDADARDPLAQLALGPPDYAWITAELAAAARPSTAGRIVSLLEGGYDLDALAEGVAAHLEALQAAA